MGSLRIAVVALRRGGILLFLLGMIQAMPLLANEVTGELKMWHRVSITFDGPQSGESATVNPFMDYRLMVTFTHASSGTSYIVPGFYAADGNAGESSATTGSKWRVHFTPDHEGTWTYTASFTTGNKIAIDLNLSAGQSTSFDGASGSFSIAPTDKAGDDFRGKGMLRYVGEHHLQFAETGASYVKVSPNSPENLLAYADFDGTYDTNCNGEGIDQTIHYYNPHVADWQNGDPSWQSGKGKGLVGALNYLSSEGINSAYFLTYNLDGGDGCDVWPWTSESERERFDVSKLDQWEVIFSHMDAKGIQLHIILTERENAKELGPPDAPDNNDLNDVRKLYYRELIARFGHHLAVQWNIGEENTNGDNKKVEFAEYIRSLDPYNHPITVHTSDSKSYTFYENLFDDPVFEATSLQANIEDYNDLAIYYREQTAAAGRKWAVYADEQAPNAGNSRADELRKEGLWGNLMGGGGGVEWFTTNDLGIEDFRSFDVLWAQMGHARRFFDAYMPLAQMEPANNLTSDNSDYVLAQDGEIYAVYLPQGGSASLNVGGSSSKSFDVRWYDPRNGGGLQQGSVATVNGGGTRNLGTPPSSNNLDWIVVVGTDSGIGGGDLPELTVSVVTEEGLETDGAVVSARFKIERTGDTSQSLSFTFALSGSAQEGVDYETVSHTAVIDAGKTSKNILITPISDSEIEQNETVILTLQESTAYEIAPNQSTATVFIIDDDGGYVLGDPSGNGSVSALDAAMILQHVVGDVVLDEVAFTAGDVSGDGSITAYDASVILQYMVGIIDCFPADTICSGSGN